MMHIWKNNEHFEKENKLFKYGSFCHEISGFLPVDKRYFSIWQTCKRYNICLISLVILCLHISSWKKGLPEDKLTEFIIETMASMSAVLKTFPIVYNEKILCELLKMTRKLSKKDNIEEVKISDFWLNLQYKLTKLLIILYSFLLSTYFIMSILRNGELPFGAGFSQSVYKTPWFQITYGIISVFSVFRLIGVSSCDILIVTFLCQLCSILKIVQNSIKKLKKLDRQLLFHAIAKHTIALEYGEKICTCISMLFLLQIILFAFGTCFAGITMLMTNNTMLIIKMISFIMTSFCEMLFTCYIGELLTTESLKIADEINSNAYGKFLHDITSVQILNFMLLRAQKPLKLGIGSTEMNLRFFSQIVNKIVSVFMVFKTMLE